MSAADIALAKDVLGYQPFIISDDAVTGVAYSWLHDSDPELPETIGRKLYLYERDTAGDEVFKRAFDANVQLMKTYDAYVKALCSLFPGASYLDVSCNTGYFPVLASLSGMGECVGLEPTDQAAAFAFLNRITGGRATYLRGLYYSAPPTILRQVGNDGCELGRQFDIVSSVEFLCHLADPLHFLSALAKIATKAIFLWSGFVESEDLLIRLNPVQEQLQPGAAPPLLWTRFKSGCAPSVKLLMTAMYMLGFPRVVEIGYPKDGLPKNWHEAKMRHYQPHRAFVFIREQYYDDAVASLRRVHGTTVSPTTL